MQWDAGKNLGFSDAPADALYLPVDPAEDAPTVEAQEKDPQSLLNTVRALLKLRHEQEDLQADAAFATVCTQKDKPFVYKRGSLLVAVNPSGSALDTGVDAAGRKVLFAIGDVKADGTLCMGEQSFAVLA